MALPNQKPAASFAIKGDEEKKENSKNNNNRNSSTLSQPKTIVTIERTTIDELIWAWDNKGMFMCILTHLLSIFVRLIC